MPLPLNQIICGNCLEVMRSFPNECVDFVQFSPPYYGLRDYGEVTETVWGGDENCQHEWCEEVALHDNLRPSKVSPKTIVGSNKNLEFRTGKEKPSNFCLKCGAWRGQLGLEPSWRMYVEHMVEVCREIKRVLKKTGSMYIVIGDTYAGSMQGYGQKRPSKTGFQFIGNGFYAASIMKPPQSKAAGYKPKCLMGIPWHLAFALIDDGWILRNDIIWHKPNAMPSSVKDRLTQTYEHIFHFVKSRKYYYNLDNIREPHKTDFAPFNLRVRDVKRGKGGVSAFGRLKASEKEVQSYVYPENVFAEGLKKVYDLMTEAKSTYDSKYRKEEYGQSLQFFVREDAIARMREASRQVAKELFPQDGKLQQKFINWVHDHAGHPKGRNPGDVVLIKHDLAVNRVGNFSYTDPLHTKAYNPKGKNPGNCLEAPKEVPSFREFPFQTNTLAVPIDVFADFKNFISSIIDEFVNSPSRVRGDKSQPNSKLLRKMLRNAFKHLFSSTPHNPNFAVVFGDPYTSITIKQTSDEVTLIFGSHWWKIKPMRLPRSNSEESQISCHSFAVNLNLVSLPIPAWAFFFQNWHVGFPSSLDKSHQFPIFARESNSGVGSNSVNQNSSIGGDKTQNVSHFVRPSSEIELIKSMLSLIMKSAHTIYIGQEQINTFAGDFWSVSTKPFKGAHFAVYPVDICLRPILSSCPPDGTILDPMCGSGSTLVAAELINRRMWDKFSLPVNDIARKVNWDLKWIGVELNSDYVELARKRLSQFPARLDKFCEEKG